MYKCSIEEAKLHRFSILLHNVKSAKSEAILRHTDPKHKYKYKTNHVGAGVLDSPFLPIHTCDIRTNDGRGEQCSHAFVRLQGLYKFKPRHSPKRDVGGAVPYIWLLWFCVPQNRWRSLRGKFVKGTT